jgi:hypothetical protein
MKQTAKHHAITRIALVGLLGACGLVAYNIATQGRITLLSTADCKRTYESPELPADWEETVGINTPPDGATFYEKPPETEIGLEDGCTFVEEDSFVGIADLTTVQSTSTSTTSTSLATTTTVPVPL